MRWCNDNKYYRKLFIICAIISFLTKWIESGVFLGRREGVRMKIEPRKRRKALRKSKFFFNLSSNDLLYNPIEDLPFTPSTTTKKLQKKNPKQHTLTQQFSFYWQVLFSSFFLFLNNKSTCTIMQTQKKNTSSFQKYFVSFRFFGECFDLINVFVGQHFCAHL